MSKVESVLGALKYVPASVAQKVLGKINPHFDNYFSRAVSLGFDANSALDYLIGRFASPGKENFKSQLQKGAEQGTLRPDEQIAQNQISASEAPNRILKGAAALGIGGLAGRAGKAAQVATQASPEPQDSANYAQAIPAEAQVLPKQQTAQGPANLAKGASSAVQGMATTAGFGSFLSKFPELGKFIDERMKSGIAPEDAAMQAKAIKKFQTQIFQLEQNFEEPFEDLISYLFYGSQKKSAPQQAKQNGKNDDLLQAIKAVRAAQQAQGR